MEEAFEAIAREVTANTLSQDKGCLRYEWYRADASQNYILIERWTDQAARPGSHQCRSHRCTHAKNSGLRTREVFSRCDSHESNSWCPAGLVALYSENATFTPQMGLEGKAPLVTPKGTFKPTELPGFFAALAAEVDFTTWENRQFVVDGNTVVALGYYAGKNKRTSEFAHVSTIADGKFTSFKEFTDTAAILAASPA